MSKIAVVNFNSGEISPEVDARGDIEKYVGGCRRLENMFPDQYGNATRRPGTELIVAGNGAACYYEFTADPAKIQITTPQGLQDIENDLNGDYELANAINMQGFSFTPIGQSGPFTGTLNGNFFTVKNLSILLVNDSFGAMFKETDEADIRNIIIKDATIQGFTNMAVLVSDCNDTDITFCSATGTMAGRTSDDALGNSGGLIASTSGSLSKEITECWANVAIFNGSTNSSGSNVGCFMGVSGGNNSISDCYASGSMTTLTESPFQGSAWGNFIGTNTQGNTISRCYASGSTPPEFVNNTTRQAFSGSTATGTGVNCFWDGEAAVTPGGSTDFLATEKTTSQMRSEATFTNWDFDTIWQIDQGNSYPKLRWIESGQGLVKEVCQRV